MLLSILRVLPVFCCWIEKSFKSSHKSNTFCMIVVNNSVPAVMAGPNLHFKKDLELSTSPNLWIWGLKHTFLTWKLTICFNNECRRTHFTWFDTKILKNLQKTFTFTFCFRSASERRNLQCCQIQAYEFNLNIAKNK